MQIKRAYAPAEHADGLRVLVDRLWPRGVTKAKAKIDLWLKDIAPSDALRHGMHDGSMTWEHFVTAYRRELEREPASTAAATLREHVRDGAVTLIYSARDETHNNAVALMDWLEAKD